MRRSEAGEKSMKTILKKIRDNYVIHQVQKAKLPVFETNPMKRYRIIFSGRVQKVGFRLEVCELAKRLELTGFCKNLDNGNVMAELQGPDNKIKYLISFMESLKRIQINHKVMEELDVVEKERGFLRQ